MAIRAVSISEVIDSSPFTSYQVLVGLLCFCCTLLDGFAMTIIAVAAPKIAEHLLVKPQALGLAMSAGQSGPLVGAALLGMLADRVGRKGMLIACALDFGLFIVLCAFITSVGQLALFLFMAGLGLGGAVPTAIALGTGYTPARSRGTLSTIIYAGVPVGATISGLAAVYLLPHYGWQSLFIMGGALPVLIAALMAVLLPESLTFLAGREQGQAKVRTIIAKIAPAFAKDREIEFCSTDIRRTGVPVKYLFAEGRATTTLLLWACFFVGYYLIYLLISWAPTLLRNSGASVQQYSLAFALINLGSAMATITVGRLMDKAGDRYRVLRTGFILGFLSLVAFGFFATSPFIAIAAVSVICGLFINGTVSGLVALGTVLYPPDLTGSALGWAYAIGRSGAMIAPLAGGVFIGLNWTVFEICSTNAVGALIIVGLIAALAAYSARNRVEEPEAVLRQVS